MGRSSNRKKQQRLQRATAPAAPANRGRRLLLGVLAGIVVLAAVAVAATRIASGGGGTGSTQTAPVRVEGGTRLPELPQSGPDPAVGTVPPALVGSSFDGTPVEVRPGRAPTLVLFAAHWCPHCQAELPRLAGPLRDQVPGGVEVVAVSTGTNRNAPNHPPSRWFDRLDWPTPVLADDADGSAARAYGLGGYPYFVFLDRTGAVAARRSGAQPVDQVVETLRQLAAA